MRLIIIILVFFFSNPMHGSCQSTCKNVYIWDFSLKSGGTNFITESLTNEVEDILSELNCVLLQRRSYNKLQNHINNEKAIFSLEGLADSITTQLKTIQAERVLFGKIEQDFSFNIKLRLTLEELSTKQIKTTTLILKEKDVFDIRRRRIVLIQHLSNLFSDKINTSSSKVNEMTFTDERNGKKYNLIQRNNKIWMAENISYIPNNGKFRAYKNNEVNGEKYGYFYDWNTAMSICPQGWRLPTYYELIDLILPYGKISYSGEDQKFRIIFGPYAPDETGNTLYKLASDKNLNIHVLEREKFTDTRTMFWTSSLREDNEDAYAIYWRGIEKFSPNGSIHFSGYPVDFLGFCRCIKDD